MTEKAREKLKSCIRHQKMLMYLGALDLDRSDFRKYNKLLKPDYAPCFASAYAARMQHKGNNSTKNLAETEQIHKEISKINRHINMQLYRLLLSPEMRDFVDEQPDPLRTEYALKYLFLAGVISNKKDTLKHVRNAIRIMTHTPIRDEEMRYEPPQDGAARRMMEFRKRNEERNQ